MASRIITGKTRPVPPAATPEVQGKAGVSRARVDEASEGQRLDNFLLKTLKGVPKTHIYRLIRSGEVRVNKGRASADTRLALGDEVRIPPVRTSSTGAGGVTESAPVRSQHGAKAKEPFPILWEDDSLLAIHKPAGVAVHGGSGVLFGVIEQLRKSRPEAKFLELVHRLDRETSGVLLIAKRRSALVALQDQFRQRQTGKIYWTLVKGEWPDNIKVIDSSLLRTTDSRGDRQVKVVAEDVTAARRAITLVKVLQRWKGFTLLEVTIKTGRTHQIRVHLQSQGHPIVGDDKYGDFEWNHALARGRLLQGIRFDRMFLHARRLRFQHPKTEEAITLEAALPQDCENLVQNLSQCTN